MSEMDGNESSLATDPHIKVLVVYGSPLLNSALVSLLVQDRDIAPIGTALSGRIAAECLQQAQADVVLCGVRQTEDVGHMVTPILAVRPESRVLVLGSTHSQRVQMACMEAGAAGYICDDLDPQHLSQAIRRIYAGEIVYSQPVLAHLLSRSSRRARRVPQALDGPQLAPREIEVLEALILGMGTEDVADHLGITGSTVRTHLKKILEKLGAHSKLEAAITALRMGIVSLPSEEDRG